MLICKALLCLPLQEAPNLLLGQIGTLIIQIISTKYSLWGIWKWRAYCLYRSLHMNICKKIHYDLVLHKHEDLFKEEWGHDSFLTIVSLHYQEDIGKYKEQKKSHSITSNSITSSELPFHICYLRMVFFIFQKRIWLLHL